MPAASEREPQAKAATGGLEECEALRRRHQPPEAWRVGAVARRLPATLTARLGDVGHESLKLLHFHHASDKVQLQKSRSGFVLEVLDIRGGKAADEATGSGSANSA